MKFNTDGFSSSRNDLKNVVADVMTKNCLVAKHNSNIDTAGETCYLCKLCKFPPKKGKSII